MFFWTLATFTAPVLAALPRQVQATTHLLKRLAASSMEGCSTCTCQQCVRKVGFDSRFFQMDPCTPSLMLTVAQSVYAFVAASVGVPLLESWHTPCVSQGACLAASLLPFPSSSPSVSRRVGPSASLLRRQSIAALTGPVMSDVDSALSLSLFNSTFRVWRTLRKA